MLFTVVPCQDAIYCSVYIAALYVRDHLKVPTDKKIYAVAWPGFVEEFAEMGYQVIVQSV